MFVVIICYYIVTAQERGPHTLLKRLKDNITARVRCDSSSNIRLHSREHLSSQSRLLYHVLTDS